MVIVIGYQVDKELSQVSEDKTEEVEIEAKTEEQTEREAECDREAAIKRVEALVKQMSLSQEQENTGNVCYNLILY